MLILARQSVVGQPNDTTRRWGFPRISFIGRKGSSSDNWKPKSVWWLHPRAQLKYITLSRANIAAEVIVLPLNFIWGVLFFVYLLKDYKRYRRKRFGNFCSKLTESGWASFCSGVHECSVIHLGDRSSRFWSMKKSEKFCSVEKVRCRSFHVSNRKNELFSTWADIGATCVFSSVIWDIKLMMICAHVTDLSLATNNHTGLI